jgi:hypothetical protein
MVSPDRRYIRGADYLRRDQAEKGGTLVDIRRCVPRAVNFATLRKPKK